MGVEYDLNDPARGESFDFGKGWHDTDNWLGEGRGYLWVPLASREETLVYVTTHFWFLQAEAHSDLCMTTHLAPEHLRNRRLPWPCDKWCPFNEPDLEYANQLADKLWAWLEGRDQNQLDVTSDSDSDDMHCRGGKDHDETCARAAEWHVRHFFVTGSRYAEDWKQPIKSK